MSKIRIAILISGRGSNMESLLQACTAPDFPAETAVVIANRPDAAGIAKAQGYGIQTSIVDHRQYVGRAAFEEALQETLLKHAPVDLVCLAGFMRILTADFVNQWQDRMINIHPSLLPDYKGLDTHARALADGRAETGCTVHYVIPAMDEGPVIVQKRVPILVGDTVDSLAARVLAEEHQAYPEAVRIVAARLSGLHRA
ncbi:MAG: phosphoribosylglycinamide formyltransferase [Micavibrio aeruginosavorus]|uniref:Phosphoribosylglycinamide formyltransferase n=1 Tax=Micavibrio aeruginosavorus TaxID=349221 RepID=A0A7T5R1W3_9BACT|nr:MAG: phosphoribosylglycinamide formyltransferase [Micavibrio aeruginosavorus]